jgi:carboxypeptidase C (cathepsin A)
MHDKSKFKNFGPMPNTTTFCSQMFTEDKEQAYSGYMNTGNDTVARNSMLYYQFYPAENTQPDNFTHAPVVLWLQGGKIIC